MTPKESTLVHVLDVFQALKEKWLPNHFSQILKRFFVIKIKVFERQ